MPRKLLPNTNKMTYQNHTPVNDYLEMKGQRDNRLWKIRQGKIYTLYNGQEMDDKEFSVMYPVNSPISFKFSRENADKSKAFLL
jgi:hypothetical protein